MATVPMYLLVAGVLVTQNALPPTLDPSSVGLMSKLLITLFAILVLLVEPAISRLATQQMGGYNSRVMLLKLSFFQSGALFGMILTLLSGNLLYVGVFGAVSLLLMAVKAPAAPR